MDYDDGNILFVDMRSEAAKRAELERIEAEERGELPMTLFGVPVIVDGKSVTRQEFAKMSKTAVA